MIAETRPNDWDELAARLLDHLDAGTTDSADGPFTVAVTDYLDDDPLGTSRSTASSGAPRSSSRSTAHLPTPGSYRVVELAGMPVLTVRQADGGVKAFINVCRHRGAQVVGARMRRGPPVHLPVPRVELRHDRRPGGRVGAVDVRRARHATRAA